SNNVGAENIAFALHYFESRGFKITSSDLGDDYPRKINYNPVTGQVKMMKLRGAYSGMVAEGENNALGTA
ncbi:MAG: hypothetical protein ACPGSC_06465, partial [Granulosicoccaceae bacterium]